MNQFYKKLPILCDDGFIFLSEIFHKHNVSLYCVGGSVRDCLLADDGLVTKTDVDLAVPISPEQVIDILDNEKIKYFTMGFEFGTITAIFNGANYEITSFRQDIKTDGRHAVVAYTPEIALDAQRRDFTMNALYYDNQGIIYDPLGCGLSDLEQKKVCFIGNSQNRIIEDYLRILRYFRFLARFGMDNYDSNIFKQYDYRNGLKILSPHRIIHELKKMIVYPFASDALAEIINLDYHHILFKDLVLTVTVFQKIKDLNPSSDYLLASLFFQSDKQNLKKNILLSKYDKKNVIDFSKIYNSIHTCLNAKNWVTLIELQYDYNHVLWYDVMSLIQLDYHNLQAYIDIIKNIILPPFTVTGKILLTQGYKQGIEISEILKQKRTEFVCEFLKDNQITL